MFMSIYLLGHCGYFSDTVVGSCRLRFFSILSSYFFSFYLFFSNRVIRKEVPWVEGVARIFQREIAN